MYEQCCCRLVCRCIDLQHHFRTVEQFAAASSGATFSKVTEFVSSSRCSQSHLCTELTMGLSVGTKSNASSFDTQDVAPCLRVCRNLSYVVCPHSKYSSHDVSVPISKLLQMLKCFWAPCFGSMALHVAIHADHSINQTKCCYSACT